MKSKILLISVLVAIGLYATPRTAFAAIGCCVTNNGTNQFNSNVNPCNATTCGGRCIEEASCPTSTPLICCVNNQQYGSPFSINQATQCNSACANVDPNATCKQQDQCTGGTIVCPAVEIGTYVCCNASNGKVYPTVFTCKSWCDNRCSSPNSCFQGNDCPVVAGGTASSDPTPPPTNTPRTAIGLPNPLGTTDLRVILGRVVGLFLGGVGSFALIMFVYGGFIWLTSAGNPERIKKGQSTLVWAVVGMGLMFGSYIFVRYVLTALTTGVVKP